MNGTTLDRILELFDAGMPPRVEERSRPISFDVPFLARENFSLEEFTELHRRIRWLGWKDLLLGNRENRPVALPERGTDKSFSVALTLYPHTFPDRNTASASMKEVQERLKKGMREIQGKVTTEKIEYQLAQGVPFIEVTDTSDCFRVTESDWKVKDIGKSYFVELMQYGYGIKGWIFNNDPSGRVYMTRESRYRLFIADVKPVSDDHA